MGYCYQGRKLCCDVCGEPGARKSHCPHGYCPAIACCSRPECRARLKEARKKCNEHCKTAHEQFEMRRTIRARRLRGGDKLRCAAVTMQPAFSCVKVWFETTHTRDIVRYMATATYRAFDLLEDVTIEDYATVGRVETEPFNAE